MGGFGSAVLEALSEGGITHVRTKVLGLPDWYIEQGPQDLLRERYGLTAEGIYQSVKELVRQQRWSRRCRSIGVADRKPAAWGRAGELSSKNGKGRKGKQ